MHPTFPMGKVSQDASGDTLPEYNWLTVGLVVWDYRSSVNFFVPGFRKI